MAEQTAFEILFKKLAANGMRPEKHISERNFVVPGKDRLSNTKFIIAWNKSLIFFAYDSHGTSAYSSRTFTGIYSAIDLPEKTECHIYKKDWVDLILRNSKRKTGVKFIDEALTITSSTDWTPSRLIEQSDVQLFLEINQRIAPLKIIIEHDYLSVVEELKNKTVIGIETDLWVYEDDDLELLVNVGGQLVENMVNANIKQL